MPACQWPGEDPQYRDYHDHDWGRPETDDQALFAKLCLDGQQAGLSWLIILRKRVEYYRLFEDFDPYRMASFDENKIEQLLTEPGIVRNRLKVKALITNAQAYIALAEKGIHFSHFLWQFVDFKPIDHRLTQEKDTPTTIPQAQAMAKALKKAGFKFVGETICYAFMQAVGMVNDHLIDCPAYPCCNDQAHHLPFKE